MLDMTRPKPERDKTAMDSESEDLRAGDDGEHRGAPSDEPVGAPTGDSDAPPPA